MVESAESFESSDDEDYISSLHILKKQISRQERELDRLKSSVTYRMGEHVTNAFNSPWRIPFLPLTFPIHVVLLGLEDWIEGKARTLHSVDRTGFRK